MDLLRIKAVIPLAKFRLKLTLSNGQDVERDVSHLLIGPIFEPVREQPGYFEKAGVAAGTVCWPNGADLCADVLIWGGAPPVEVGLAAPSFLAVVVA